jgi:succinate dehydrogenase / fumarate reductase cytochrome b subunit
MKWSEFFTSSIGKKFIMSLTGIFLISFLVVHVGVNACIWANDGGEMFNLASHFMATTIVIRIVEVGLFAGLLLHIVQGLVLEVQNRSHRRIGYAVAMGNKGSKWYSRSMGLLGTLPSRAGAQGKEALKLGPIQWRDASGKLLSGPPKTKPAR